MKVSPFCKRFKRTHFTGDTLPLPDKRSSIIRRMQGYNYHQNMANLWKLKNQPQNRGNDKQKTDRITDVYDRAIWSFLHLIIEMILILVYCSYVTKNHKLSSVFVPGYQCSNIYINIEKGALMNKDKQ